MVCVLRCELLVEWCRAHRIFEVDGNCDLFHNKGIGRRLSIEGVTCTLEHLVAKGLGDWVDSKRKEKCHVFWNTPSQWADIILYVPVPTLNVVLFVQLLY